MQIQDLCSHCIQPLYHLEHLIFHRSSHRYKICKFSEWIRGWLIDIVWHYQISQLFQQLACQRLQLFLQMKHYIKHTKAWSNYDNSLYQRFSEAMEDGGQHREMCPLIDILGMIKSTPGQIVVNDLNMHIIKQIGRTQKYKKTSSSQRYYSVQGRRKSSTVVWRTVSPFYLLNIPGPTCEIFVSVTRLQNLFFFT